LNPGNWLLPVFGFGAAILTAFYMFRLIYLTFHNEFHSGPEAEKHLHEAPLNMTLPVGIMAVLSIFFWWNIPGLNPISAEGGWFANLIPEKEKVVVAASAAYGAETHVVPAGEEAHAEVITGEEVEHAEVPIEEHTASSTMRSEETAHDAVASGEGAGEPAVHSEEEQVRHQAHSTAMIISIFMAGLGILIAYLGYLKWIIDPAVWQKRLGILYQGMFHKWWIDEVYNAVFVRGVHLAAKILAFFDLYVVDGIVNGAAAIWRGMSYVSGWFDLNVVDGLVNFTAWFVGLWGRFVRLFQTGNLQRYIWITAVVVAIFLFLKL
jgi:NADH-quinone oxidoreductase subunit L